MTSHLVQVQYEVELGPGEQLTLPASLVDTLGEGRWLITIQPATEAGVSLRRHSAFLESYAPEDEGLYDDYPAR